MNLIDIRGNGYLFELKPSLFPEGELTPVELTLWSIFYSKKKRELERNKNGN